MFNLMPWKKKQQHDVARFQNEADDLFSRFFDDRFFGMRSPFSQGGLLPQVDVSETGKKITVKAEVPGVDKKDIEVLVDGRLLTIKGEKKQEKEDKGVNYHRIESAYGSFNRTVELPAEVDEANVDASYKDGILKIVMKKIKESEAKKIKVNAA